MNSLHSASQLLLLLIFYLLGRRRLSQLERGHKSLLCRWSGCARVDGSEQDAQGQEGDRVAEDHAG